MARADRTPRRFTTRISGLPRRLGRAMEGSVDSTRTYGDALEVRDDGRLDVRVRSGGPLKMTRRGLEFDESRLGEKNHDPLRFLSDISTSATSAEIAGAYNKLLAELRRTKRMRGGI